MEYIVQYYSLYEGELIINESFLYLYKIMC
jgi:hypothetical protein